MKLKKLLRLNGFKNLAEYDNFCTIFDEIPEIEIAIKKEGRNPNEDNTPLDLSFNHWMQPMKDKNSDDTWDADHTF